MISRTAVYEDLLTALRDDDAEVGFTGAPNPAPAQYQVLEVPPARADDDGDLEDPHRHLLLRVKLRTVTEANDREAATLAATALADAGKALVRGFEGHAGDGWKCISAKWLSTLGADNQGTLANVLDEYELLVVPGAPAEP